MSIIMVFFQGILSFFSPCIFPLLPVYMSYLSGKKDASRKTILWNTFFFVLGISCTFFLLGFGFTSLGQFFSSHQVLISRIGGIIMILFGLYQFGVFGSISKLDQERRLPFKMETMNTFSAFVLGFTFSFAWTPCVGPTLASVLLLASASNTMMQGMGLMSVYVLGFILPFMALGFFTSQFLNWMKKHGNIVHYTVKIGAIILVVLGAKMFLSTIDFSPLKEPVAQQDEVVAAPNFTLKDQFGQEHTISEYKGKVIFLNFWATWCGPCQHEIPYIQKMYEKYKDEVVFLGVTNEYEGDVLSFVEENNMTYPTLMDESGEVFRRYGIRSFPTTFMIDVDGNVYGAVHGSVNEEMIEKMIELTINQE